MQTIEELLAVHTYLTADDLVCDRCDCTCPPAAGDTCAGCDGVEQGNEFCTEKDSWPTKTCQR